MTVPRPIGANREATVALVGGLALVLGALAAAGVVYARHPAGAAALAAQTAAHLLVGRETGIPVGLALGTRGPVVALVAFVQDAVVLLVGYGLAIHAAHGMTRFRFARRLAERFPRPEETKRSEPVGVAVLAASIWIPFLPTGALVAALAGRAFGYRAVALIPSLLVSIALASAAYTWTFATTLAALTLVDRLVLVAFMAAVAAAVAWITRERAAG